MRKAAEQFAKYAIVGIISNALLYGGYLALVSLGLGHKTSMTITYCVGVAWTFFFNRSWSFRDTGLWHRTLALYVAVYAFGYVLNIVGLIKL